MIPGYLVRKACYKILRQQETQGRFVKDAFSEVIQNIESSTSTTFRTEERALIHTIVLGVIRSRFLLNHNISQVHSGPIKPAKVQTILHIATYQLWLLDSIPEYAAVNTAVELAKKEVGIHPAKFVNALLKKLSKISLKHMEGNTHKSLSTNYSYPMWIVKTWATQVNQQTLLSILQAGNTPSFNWLRINLSKTNIKEFQTDILSEFSQDFLSFQKTSSSFPYFTWNISPQKIVQSSWFQNGIISFQDPSSHYIIPLLQYQTGHKVLDLCSAPGGKAAAIMEYHNIQSEVYCSDLSYKRLSFIKDNQNRLGHHNLVPFVTDGTQPGVKAIFDTVLIDAPCSNLGVLSRRPEARWRSEKDLKQLTSIQLQLLQQAAKLVHSTGALVYATCSPTTAETWDVIQSFLQKHQDWKLIPMDSILPPKLLRKGCLWTYPGEEDCDGFFAARLQKKGSHSE